MKILIIGNGGREHVLAATYARSNRVKKVFVAPGNDFMDEQNKIQTLPSINVFDFEKIIAFAKKEQIDLVDVAQDDPLAAGLIDELDDNEIPAFGPKQKAAELEWNKTWAREFMSKYQLPTPCYHRFSNEKEAVAFITKHPERLFYVKAAGLAGGKGAIRAENRSEAISAILQMKTFGKAGKQFLIEEGITGEEFSLFAICDGKNYVVANAAQDHKTVWNSDTGPNTGGMGCIAPISIISKQAISHIKRNILTPLMEGMQKEGRPFVGILYLGGMMTNAGIQIIEFNARWGDPEAEIILPGLQTDYVDVVEAALMGKLSDIKVSFDKKFRISIAGCAKGYPEDYQRVKGKKIFGLEKAMKMPGIIIFGAGIKRSGKHFVVNGGRIFHLVAEGKTLDETREKAYAAMSHIFIEGNNLHYRTDIGWREVEGGSSKSA